MTGVLTQELKSASDINLTGTYDTLMPMIRTYDTLMLVARAYYRTIRDAPRDIGLGGLGFSVQAQAGLAGLPDKLERTHLQV